MTTSVQTCGDYDSALLSSAAVWLPVPGLVTDCPYACMRENRLMRTLTLHRVSRGFTLIELLVVLVIIGVL